MPNMFSRYCATAQGFMMADLLRQGLLRDCDLMQIVGLQHSAFYKNKAQGLYRKFESPEFSRPGKTLYCGQKIRDAYDGKCLAVERPELRAFGSARRRANTVQKPAGRPRLSVVQKIGA